MTPSVAAPPLVEPTYHSCPPYAYTFGPEVADLVALCSDDKGPFVMDPEQRLVLDDIFGCLPDGKNAAFEAAVIGCRQNLKTGVLKAAALGKVFVLEHRLVVWSAHQFFASREAFRDLQILIESSPDLDREVIRVLTGAGSESIELTHDRRLLFKARTSGSGRSLSGDDVILDEAFALDGGEVGALLPTLAARPNPQVLYGSSAGMASSAVLRRLRDRGRAGANRVAYAEWAATRTNCASRLCTHEVGADGCALDDRGLWLEANTAVHRGRITMDTIAGLRQGMPPEEFMRECLGWWDDPTGDALIPADLWDDLLALSVGDDSRPMDPLSFGLDVSPNQSMAAIGVCGSTAAGSPFVELTNRDALVDHRPGMAWVLPRLVEIKDAQARPTTVSVAAGSEAMALKPGLESAGITVEVVSTTNLAAACGHLYGAATGRTLRHSGQVELAAAVASARRDNDDGERAWKWHRRRSGADITPLYAVTLAAWAAQDTGRSKYEDQDLVTV